MHLTESVSIDNVKGEHLVVRNEGGSVTEMNAAPKESIQTEA